MNFSFVDAKYDENLFFLFMKCGNGNNCVKLLKSSQSEFFEILEQGYLTPDNLNVPAFGRDPL
jgi:hypothetical protein